MGVEAQDGMVLSGIESEEVSEAWFGEVDCGWDSER